jgi:opacity protein-like surface antigen
MRFIYICILLILLINTPIAQAQSKFSPTFGAFYNGTGLTEDVKGFGLIAGLEYKQRKDHLFSVELRTRYGYYSFDDGTKWGVNNEGVSSPPKNKNNARLEYALFSPRVGVVPKVHLYIDEDLSLFIENEGSFGLMTGTFKYTGQPSVEKSFTETIFCYNVGIGAEYKKNDNWSLVGSVGYSSLNFRSKIRNHQPDYYDGVIPNQNAGLLVNVTIKIPLRK